MLLEPVMAVEVVTPEDYLGDVMGDLNSRRGRVEEMEPRGERAGRSRAQVPLAEMFGYATDLRSMTQGRATYTMQFDRTQQVPQSIASEIVVERATRDFDNRSDGGLQWPRRSSSAPSRTSTSARSVTSTTARRR